LGNK
jgi:catechol 2,3-dioxygenase-like lactoylglutathione lyase family enzyme